MCMAGSGTWLKDQKEKKNFLSEITQNCQTTLPPLNIILNFKSWNTKSSLGKFINHVATRDGGEGLKFPKIG